MSPNQCAGCRNRGSFGLRSKRCANPARMRPTDEDQEGRLVTTNDDTPQIFGEDKHDDDVFTMAWRDGAADTARAGAEVRDAADGFAEKDEAGEVSEAEP